MSNRSFHLVTPDILLRAYAAGIFPMAESADAQGLHWFDPPVRALIPLDTFHVPKRLARTLRKKPYEMRLDTAFGAVMRACAAPAPGRATTWINDEILRLYGALHRRGHAHSIEAWEAGELVGGLYGVSLGGAFFGESMFSRKTDASKIALTYLVALLKDCHFTLLDTQFQTPHLTQFGTFEITRANYHHLLEVALKRPARIRRPVDWDHLALAPGAGAAGLGVGGAAGGSVPAGG
jgi:leucyl/phenylalanyl-tRNA--protein transferase